MRHDRQSLRCAGGLTWACSAAAGERREVMGFFASSGILNRRGFFGGAFSPSNIPNLGLWLDANVGVTYDGSNRVSQWNDQSGNGRNVTQTAVASRKPTFLSNQLNGKPAIDFYGSSNSANVLVGTNKDFMYDAGAASVFVVLASNSLINPPNGDTNVFLISERGGSPITTYAIVAAQQTATSKLNAFMVATPAGQTEFRLSYQLPNGYGTAYDQTWRIATMIDTGTSMSGYVNGELGVTVGYTLTRGTTPSPTEFLIGANTSGATSSFNARVAEIIIYSRALNDTERVQVENYLKSKWGI